LLFALPFFAGVAGSALTLPLTFFFAGAFLAMGASESDSAFLTTEALFPAGFFVFARGISLSLSLSAFALRLAAAFSLVLIVLASLVAAFSIFSFSLTSLSLRGVSESDDSPIWAAVALGGFLAFSGTSLSSDSDSSLTCLVCCEVRRRLL
jgi:hypothetical protein